MQERMDSIICMIGNLEITLLQNSTVKH